MFLLAILVHPLTCELRSHINGIFKYSVFKLQTCLKLNKIGIVAALHAELFMGAFLDDASVTHNKDLVAVLGGRDPLCDDDLRAVEV